MPTVRHLLLNPRDRRADPAPLAVDLTGVFGIGIAGWVVALIVTWFRWQAGQVPATSALTCVAGIALGVIAVIWARHQREPQVDAPAS
ncbi:DUF2530 domain-containing protein [Pengzhenrongella sicca]|uniref:DUF2530 domain-containing protein n=1 Tax=Pengzhenrongella sicca TaxID=2819238 RepID=A0A8A4ZH40_9MICO|nr:DUF2530 domain-containing protein [Pengzhenrongella sicca]QTE29846.1 DUF2530 domain-containing protein [Pengzhenrongella sicca]